MVMMMMLLLVCTMAPLVILAGPVTIHHKLDENLNQIIDLVEEYNKSLNREFFVEDVRPLVDAGCNKTFFCKVHEILENRKQFNEIVRNLKKHIKNSHANCTELLKDVTPNGISIELPELTEYLVMCIRQRNFSMG